ncbi:MAG: hypothetical protein ABIF09_10915 [Gemmatimonadota bacterium]
MRLGQKSGLVLAVFVLLVGCQAQDGDGTAGVARDSAGVTIIDLPNPAVYGADTELLIDPTWNPSEGLEIGSLIDVGVVQDRGTLLLDELAGNVSYISDSGDLLALIGHEGEGPGEFNPQGLSQVVATDSSVFIPDLFLQRLTEFDLEGNVLKMQGFPLSPVYAVDWRGHPDGGLAFRAFEQFGDQIIRLSAEKADTIFSLQISNDYVNLLLSPITLWALTENGDVVVARTDRAVVELRRGGTGELLRRVQWSRSAEELDETAVAHLESLVRERILRDTPDISAEGLSGTLAPIQYPEMAPVLAGLFVSSGDIWVRRAKPVREMGIESLQVGSAEAFGGQYWDVLDREGFLKTSVKLPDRFTPTRFSGGWIYGILADEWGVESVRRIEIGFQ